MNAYFSKIFVRFSYQQELKLLNKKNAYFYVNLYVYVHMYVHVLIIT
jgi:DNA phosphorothioation-dependent restriction protein DptG